MEQTTESGELGFSGLVSLVSDIEETISEASSIAILEVPQSRLGKSNLKGKSKDYGPLPQQSKFQWKYLIATVVVILIAFYSEEICSLFSSSNNVASQQTVNPSSTQTTNINPSRPLSPSLPTPEIPTSTSTISDYATEKPPVGTKNLLSISQIRWCLEEEISLNTISSLVDNYDKKSVNAFNRLVDDYNIRCGSYKYRRGSLESAKSEVEKNRDKIVLLAINDAEKYGISTVNVPISTTNSKPEGSKPVVLSTTLKPTTPKPKTSVTAGTTYGSPKEGGNNHSKLVTNDKTTSNYVVQPTEKNMPDKKVTQVQNLLKQLGYNPGMVDGKYGSQTVSAIKAFQKKHGMVQTGEINEVLLFKLYFEKAKRK